MASAIDSVRSSSRAVFSIMGTSRVLKYASVLPTPPRRTPLIISWCEMRNDLAPLPRRRVSMTGVSGLSEVREGGGRGTVDGKD
jgi:hypothetical protein